jgi:transposase
VNIYIDFDRKWELRALCENAGVYIEYLPLYSLEFNLIKYAFYNLKMWIRRYINELSIYKDFRSFLRLGIESIGSRIAARSHFRHIGYLVVN